MMSAEELESIIEKLKGKDKVGVAGEILATAGGGVAGVAAAGTIASAAGASTLLGSTTLASTLGGVFVTTTPVGWVVGAAIVVGAAGYGIAKMVRSGSDQDHVRQEVIKKLQARLDAMQSSEANLALERLYILLPELVEKGLITEEQAERIVSLIEKGRLSADIALTRLSYLVKNYNHQDI
jgi:hypothetical protein